VSRPAIFLDRDGVIAGSRRAVEQSLPPISVGDLVIPGGVADALTALHEAGYCLVVVTNQPDVARGLATRADVEAINEALRAALPLDAIYNCFHDGPDCACRKPRPGMLLDASGDLNLDLDRSWMVGDRWVDVAAGSAAGVHTILIDRPWSWNATSSGEPPPELVPHEFAANLGEAATLILGRAQ
jgi:D-glycero-D-manno-heptose 1,7-bisphosphate phosphatase